MTEGGPKGRVGWFDRMRAALREHLIDPFLETYDPLGQVAWGAAIGVFVGLTPTVGIQMYIVTMVWLICRYAFRLRFNLTIGISMVWLSNPITMLPLYYLFLKTGDLLLWLTGSPTLDMTFELFKARVALLSESHGGGWSGWLISAGQVFLVQFGWPIVLGSLVYAVPGCVLTYPITYAALRRYRQYLAASEGITYAEWRERYEDRS